MGNGGSIIGGLSTTTKSSTTSSKKTTTTSSKTTSSLLKTTTSLLLTTTPATTLIKTTSSPTPLLSSSSTTSSYTVGTTTEAVPVVTTPVTTVSTLPASAASAVPSGTTGGTVVQGASVDSTVLVFARSSSDAAIVTDGLDGYGIPYSAIIVPQSGITLPQLNSTPTTGNYGGIIIHAELSYDYGTASASNYSSAFTADQWNQLYAYQTSFNVRMARLDVYPGPNFDAAVASSCCNTGVEQLLSFTDVSDFPTAGLVANQGVSSQGLYHYTATITNTTRTKQIAAFAASSDGTTAGNTAAVINNFDGREQMAWFTSMATVWALETNFIMHSWIHWVTHGTFAGKRRLLFSTQVDDVHLITDIYDPNNTEFRIRKEDMAALVTWMADVNGRMPTGSEYILELGHNGNGDIENATSTDAGYTTCNPNEAIEYPDQIDTALEFQKVVGTGTNIWPATPLNYTWSLDCAKLDPLAAWFMVPANRDAFGHISHTFSHMSLNNATFSDAWKEIQFNVKWLAQTGISAGKMFSSKGLIPPAITGLHNGDVLNAWSQQGLYHCVGDNTRPALMVTSNQFWPTISTVAANGFDGYTIIPRWATTIYYNCNTLDCCAAEWKATSGASGVVSELLDNARVTNVRNLLSLRQDPYMFHQANLRNIDMPTVTAGGATGKLGILQQWVEIMVAEMTRLTTWPFQTVKQDDLAVQFTQRMARDKCGYKLTHHYSTDGKTIVSSTLTTGSSNVCSAPIPVSIPGTATYTGSPTVDKLGNDPTILWFTLNGSPATITYGTPIALA